MRILQASMENFRGIRQATIRFPSHTLILGPNDACKSTVLEALNFALGPDRIRGADPVDEHDFFQGDYLYREHGADDLGEGETQLASDESQGSATDQVPSEVGDGPLPESAWPPAGSPRGCPAAPAPAARVPASALRARFLPTRIRLAACRAFTFRWPSPRNGLASAPSGFVPPVPRHSGPSSGPRFSAWPQSAVSGPTSLGGGAGIASNSARRRSDTLDCTAIIR